MLDLPGYWHQPQGTASTGRYAMVLFPSDPALVASLNVCDLPFRPLGTAVMTTENFSTPIPYPIRIRAIDVSDWRSTHLMEAWLLPTTDGEVPDSYRLIFESPRATRWLTVITAGPLWGCFVFDAQRDADHSSTALHQLAPDSYPRSSPTDTDDLASVGEQAAGTSLPVGVQPDRECVDGDVQRMFLRAGEIMALMSFSISARLPPNPQRPGVYWAPAYRGDTGAFDLRAIHMAGDDSEPNHSYHVTSPLLGDGRTSFGDAQERRVEIAQGMYGTDTSG